MIKKYKLGILDQSIVRKGSSASDAIEETLNTVLLAEELGFNRFWVSEHHNAPSIAGSAPEILMVRLAALTKKIRIGSGGIMLPNHSALKVAENFRLLETLFPGRIDLGMGRAPGGDRITASLLNPSNDFSEESYITQLDHLQRFFTDTAATNYGSLLAVPQAVTIPDQWILSSSGGSSRIAADLGMGLVVARFINGQASKEITDLYRKHFTPSEQFPEPRVMVAINVLCADTDQKAKEMRKLIDHRLLQFEKGNFDKPGTYESIRDHEFTNQEKERIFYNNGRIISGNQQEVKDQIIALANEFDTDEIIAATMTDNFEDRKRSFELLSQAFDLV